jgi:hypothetical protein
VVRRLRVGLGLLACGDDLRGGCHGDRLLEPGSEDRGDQLLALRLNEKAPLILSMLRNSEATRPVSSSG